LSAITQFTAEYQQLMPQGLGTGQLYHNNIPSPLEVKHGKITNNLANPWDESLVSFLV
jgi:hypothetical protein